MVTQPRLSNCQSVWHQEKKAKEGKGEQKEAGEGRERRTAKGNHTIKGKGKKHKSRTRSWERKSQGRRQASRPQDIAGGGERSEAKCEAFSRAKRRAANFKM
jgi:hypothetical protein